ncbi:C-X-C chemokine receptor type 5 [Osmerus eperlanus]|uniref:C-X-C chemokine receptor type 5 n=1 Tax=Osmerus eperlanus TaxID=29151 RepID=UPI002E10F169
MAVVTEGVYDLETFDNKALFEDYFSGDENSSDISEFDGEFTCSRGTDLLLFSTVFQPLAYILMLLLGLTGNGLLLTVLLNRRGLLRVTEIYLLHLAVADLLFLFTLPFALAQMVVGWVFGELFCIMVGLLNRLNMLCSSLLLACIGCDRYLAIVHAVPSLQSRRPRNVHLTCLFLWLMCLILSAPNAAFLSVAEVQTVQTCTFHSHGIHAINWRLTNRFLTHLLCFFFPLAVMSYCYTAVVFTLCHSQRSLEKQGAIRLALLVTAVFCLCWLPYNITMLVDTLVELGAISNQSCEARVRLEQALVMTECLGFTHCCLNPILYAFVGVRFRGDLLRLLVRWGCGSVCLPLLRAPRSSRSSNSEGGTATINSTLI